MATRKIVRIDEQRCTGCGLCVPNCAEGALQIIDGKAKLITEKFCDGLGACLGHCPEDAITIIEREAEDFDERAVEAHFRKQKQAQTKSEPHPTPVFAGCPSSKAIQLKSPDAKISSPSNARVASELRQWPVQLKLVPINAPYFEDADLLITADCVPFAYANFHRDFIKGKVVVVGCPKLDDIGYYREKLTDILKSNSIKSVTVPYMEVPCCYGLVRAVEEAVAASGKHIPFQKIKISIRGEIQPEEDTGMFHRHHMHRA